MTFFAKGPDSCASRVISITPADSDLTEFCRALYIGGNGSVVITTTEGTTATFSGVPAGTILPIMTKRVALASTATNIVGLV